MTALGLLAGIIYSVGGFFVDLGVTAGWFTSAKTPGLSYGTVLAFGELIGMPIIFVIIGYLSGIVGAATFMFLSGWIKALKKIEV